MLVKLVVTKNVQDPPEGAQGSARRIDTFFFHGDPNTLSNRSKPLRQGVRGVWRGLWHALAREFIASFVFTIQGLSARIGPC